MYGEEGKKGKKAKGKGWAEREVRGRGKRIGKKKEGGRGEVRKGERDRMRGKEQREE